jgi:hypothetical protein
MAKDKISQYSTTNALNTDIGGIDIDENCLPSNLNNGIREVMVQLKEFQDGTSGDSLTITGTATLNGTTIPASKTLVDTDSVQTLTNKTLTTPVINGFTGDTSVINIGSGQVYKDASGNVGIGTSTPGVLGKLNVTTGFAATDTNERPIAFLSSSDSAVPGSSPSGLYLAYTGNASAALRKVEIAAATFGSGTTGVLSFQLGKMVIDSTGNVGIGTTSPVSALELYSDNPRITLSDLGTQATITNLSGNLYYDTSSANRDHIFQGAGTEAARITGDGLVGIGTSSPTMKLDISGTSYGGVYIKSTSTNYSGLLLENTNSATKWQIGVEGGTYNTAGKLNIGIDAVGPAIIIDSSRNVGIGTSSPASRLSSNVSGAGSVTALNLTNDNSGFAAGTGPAINFGVSTVGLGAFGKIEVLNETATIGSNSYMAFSTRGGDVLAERLRITSSGSVGIGTSSPGAKLTVKLGNIGIDQDEAPQQFFGAGGNVAGTNTTGGVLTVFGHAPNGIGDTSTPPYDGTNFVGAAGLMARGFSESAQYRGSLEFFTKTASNANATSRMLITHDGNVGISTSSPSAKFHIVGSTYDYLIGFGANEDNYYSCGSSGVHIFRNGATEAARFDASGALLVGTTISEGPSRISSVSTTSGTACVGYRNTAGAGSVFASFINSTNSAIIGTILNSGDTSTSYNTTSDYRLKEDAQPVLNPIDRLMQLKPINFAWKVNGSRTDGFLAHEAQEVVPEAVTGQKDAVDKDGKPEYQGIDQSKLVPLLTAALQELKAELDTVKAELNTLKGN